MRILVIDDDAAVAHTLSRQVAALGHEPTTCTSSELALIALASHSYDAVLADVLMPGLSGIDLLRTMRDIGYAAPVVLVTGHTSVNMAVDAAHAGAVRLLTKPVTLEDLRSAFDAAVANGAAT